MTQYVEHAAKHFDGLRLDNAHSTPLHVARHLGRPLVSSAYLLATRARKLNPALFIFAELFTGSQAKDQEYIYEVGVNALIRECIHSHTGADLVSALYKHAMPTPIGN